MKSKSELLSKKYIFKDGLTLVVVQIPFLRSLSTVAVVKSGPRYDPRGKAGLSHFIEHLLFKGTRKWDSRFSFNSALEAKGASANAFSYYETNKFWVKSSANELNLALESVVDLLKFPLLRQNDIKTEKDVVKEELRIVESNPEELIWELWSQTLWKDEPLGRYYIGSLKTIDSFLREDVLQFFQTFYKPSRTLFLVCGNVLPEQVESSLLKFWQPSLGDENILSDRQPESKTQKGSVKVLRSDSENVTVALGFKTVPYAHKDNISLRVIGNYLAGGMGSLFRRKIMEKGLTYSIEAYPRNLSDTGYLMIKYTTDPKNFSKVLGIIVQEFKNLCQGFVVKDELEIAKNYLIGSLQTQIEGSMDWSSFYEEQYLYNPGHVMSLEETCQKVKSVSSSLVQEVSGKYFGLEKICIAVIGPVSEKDVKIQ